MIRVLVALLLVGCHVSPSHTRPRTPDREEEITSGDVVDDALSEEARFLITAHHCTPCGLRGPLPNGARFELWNKLPGNGEARSPVATLTITSRSGVARTVHRAWSGSGARVTLVQHQVLSVNGEPRYVAFYFMEDGENVIRGEDTVELRATREHILALCPLDREEGCRRMTLGNEHGTAGSTRGEAWPEVTLDRGYLVRVSALPDGLTFALPIPDEASAFFRQGEARWCDIWNAMEPIPNEFF